VKSPTVQHKITPGDEPAVGIAFIWRRLQIETAESNSIRLANIAAKIDRPV
jgi:hypothetical protein